MVMETIVAFSDAHMGRGDAADDFARVAKAFEAELMVCLDRGYTIVFVGDMFEMWQPEGFGEQYEEYLRILKAHQGLLSFIYAKVREGKIHLVAGNHDSLIHKILQADKEYLFESEDRAVSVLFTHGHQADVLNSDMSIFGRVTAWVVGWFERWGWRDADYDLGKMEKYIPGRSGNPKMYKEWALQRALKEQIDVIVLGHTHIPDQQIIYDDTCSKQRRYVNCGTVMERTCGVINIRKGEGRPWEIDSAYVNRF